MVNVANEHSITLNPAYIPTHISVEAYYLLWGIHFRIASSSHYSNSISTLVLTGGVFLDIAAYQSVSELSHIRNSVTSVNTFNNPWQVCQVTFFLLLH